jgi:hypothetical protein
VTVHSRRLKFLQLSVGELDSPDESDEIAFQCQVESWNVVNNTPDGDKRFGFCYDPEQTDAENALDGEFREEAEPDYQLTAKLFADWRNNGISTYAWNHNGETVNFRLDHHPNIVGEHVAWAGRLKIKAPGVGGDARTTEMSEIAWVIIGEPTFYDNTETESN